jgi:Mg-chelatase subunit ChlD
MYEEIPAMFLPPEAMGSSSEMDESDAMDLASASTWDIATRYHEFKSRASRNDKEKAAAKKLRKLSAEAILERAKEVLGSVVHPVEYHTSPWTEIPPQAHQVELDIEETIENSPLAIASVMGLVSGKGSYPLTEQDLWMEYNISRKQPVVISIDTSLSMTGEKLALTAVALAVVLLQFPEDPVGIVAFENEAKIIKRPDERLSVEHLIERFLDVPAQGYTHLEDGMKAALRLSRAASRTSGIPSTVLLTDGKYTAGRDPAYLAPRFSHLVVLKMGKERASLELCRELASKGKGVLREVGELEALPTVMYGVVKDLLRGKSLF